MLVLELAEAFQLLCNCDKYSRVPSIDNPHLRVPFCSFPRHTRGHTPHIGRGNPIVLKPAVVRAELSEGNESFEHDETTNDIIQAIGTLTFEKVEQLFN